jgi:general secretion pathway protein G
MVTVLRPDGQPTRFRRRGFTLIELMVVLTIIALLLSLSVPRYFHSVERSKENILRANLATTRDAIDKFVGDNGRYPDSVEQLVKGRYLRTLPYDPITDSSTTWVLVPSDRPERPGAVFDLHSGAEGQASDGRPYAEW